MHSHVPGEFFRASSDGYQHEPVSCRSEIGFSSNLLVNTPQHLPPRQLALLHRGPAYVPPCHLRSRRSSSLDDTLSKQFAPLQQQLNKLFSKARVHLGRSMNFQSDVQSRFNDSFSKPLALAIAEQASNEQRLVRALRQQLERDELVLRRTADNNNVFYLDQIDRFEREAIRFILQSQAYQIIEMVVARTRTDERERQCVIDTITRFNAALQSLVQMKRLDSEQMSKMQAKPSNVELPYLYFLPAITKVNVLFASFRSFTVTSVLLRMAQHRSR